MAGSDDTLQSLRFPHLSNVEYAKFALECFYKEKHPTLHAEYKFHRALGSCRVLTSIPKHESFGVLDWCHVSFIALSRMSGCNVANEVVFFVELVDFGYGDGLVLNNFSILKPNAPEITYGCGFCPPDEDHPHPRGAYFAGEWEYRPTNDTSQEEMAISFERVISKRKTQITQTFNLKRLLLLKPEPFADDVVLDPSLRAPFLSTAEYAEIALEWYKKERGPLGPDYEVVRALGSGRVLAPIDHEVIDWCHVSFIAKPKNSNCNDDSVLFFVELVDRSYGDQLILNHFLISKLDAPGITYGCDFCPPDEDHPHPRGAYLCGQSDIVKPPNNDTSRKEIAISFQLQVISNPKKNSDPYLMRWSRMLPVSVEPDPSCFSPILSDKEYAALALSYISKAQDTKYELVETLFSNRRMCFIWKYGSFGEWIHVGFIAKPENNDVSLVHFFAEMNDPGVRKFSLITYCRLDPSGVGIEEGCGICPINEKYLHPINGLYLHPRTVTYVAGSWPHHGCLRDTGKSLECSRCNMRNYDDFFD